MDVLPVLVVDRIFPNRDFPGWFVVSGKCPLCGKRHTHGVDGRSLDKPTHRVSDCARPVEFGTYFVVVPEHVRKQVA